MEGEVPRAQVLTTPQPIADAPLELTSHDVGPPGPGEIAIAVSACGVCRTDLQLVEGDLPMRATPVVPGHQVVGTVTGLGPGATGWRVGDRVGVAWLGGA